MSDPFLQVSHVSHTFADGVQALDDVSLSVPAGGFAPWLALLAWGNPPCCAFWGG